MKRKVVIAGVAALLLLIAGGLWYTRPVPAKQVLGLEVDNLSGMLTVAYVRDGVPYMDTWVLDDGLHSGDPAFRGVMDVLEGTTLRAHLRNLLGGRENASRDLDGEEHVLLIFTDGGERSVTLDLDRRTVLVSRSWERGYFSYSLRDGQDLQALAEVFRAYGVTDD